VLALLSDRGATGSGVAFGVVAAVLAVLAGFDFWHGVPLTVDADGLRVRRGPGRVDAVPWAAIDRIEATTTSSRGLLRLASLEVDVGEQLMVVSRHRLGADPEEVADELRRRWPNPPPPRRP
jgi:hypothetical protein